MAFLYSDKDSEMSKEARKHPYDTGHFGKEGIDSSAFGKKLDNEFGGQYQHPQYGQFIEFLTSVRKHT